MYLYPFSPQAAELTTISGASVEVKVDYTDRVYLYGTGKYKNAKLLQVLNLFVEDMIFAFNPINSPHLGDGTRGDGWRSLCIVDLVLDLLVSDRIYVLGWLYG